MSGELAGAAGDVERVARRAATDGRARVSRPASERGADASLEEPAWLRAEYGEAPEEEESEARFLKSNGPGDEDAAAVLYDGPTLPAECWRPGFAEFREAYSRTTEATDAFFFAGYAVAAGLMMGRNASLRCGEPVRPLFYCVNVGETGISRKTTAQNKASEAVTLADESVLTAPGVGSAEGLLEVMAEGARPGMPSRRMLLNPSEFSSLLLKSNAEATRGLGPMLTTLWDLPLKYASPKAGKARSVTEPFLAILTSTTREWLHRDLTEDLLRGGLANRFLYFVGPEKAPIAFPPPPEPLALAEAMRRLGDARDRHGVLREYALSPEAEALYTDWYHEHRRRRPESPVLAALSHRLHSNAWRVALVYAALEGTGSVTREQMAAAVALADYQAAAHRTVFEGYGDSEGAKLAERIRAALRKHGPLPTWRLAQIVRHVEPGRLLRTLMDLANLGEIRARVKGKGKVWELRKAENTPETGKVGKVWARNSARVERE